MNDLPENQESDFRADKAAGSRGVIVLAIGIITFIVGAAGLCMGLGETSKQNSVPTAQISELSQWVGNGKEVRVTGKAVDSVLSKGGDKLAFEQVKAETGESQVVYEGWIPDDITLTDGKTNVVVRCTDTDVSYMHVAKGTLETDGTLNPEKLQSIVVKDLYDEINKHAQEHPSVSAWYIRADEPISVIGAVSKEGNNLVLKSQSGSMWIKAESQNEMNSQTTIANIAFLLLLGTGIGLLTVWFKKFKGVQA